jgi:hypothetical protein
MLQMPLPVLPLVVLPLVAATINLVALARRMERREVPVWSLQFVRRYFWTLALVFVALGWVAFLYGHDTFGCGVQNLPALDWDGFRRCAAAH